MALPAYKTTGQRFWHYVYLAFCAFVMFFLVAPLVAVIPLSFTAEAFLNFTPGMLSRIRSPEGAVMAVNYATTNFFYEEHTGANVPVFANQVGQGIVPPYLQQPELFTIMRDYLRLPE